MNLNIICLYSQTSPQQPPWGQNKVALLWRGGYYGEVGGNMTNFFRGVQHVYFAKFMPTVSHNDNPIIMMIHKTKMHKKLR